MEQSIEEQRNPMREKALNDYIELKHHQAECIGFYDGFEKCQEQLQPLVDSHAELLMLLNVIEDSTNGGKEDNYIGIGLSMLIKAAIEKANLLNK